VIDRRDQREEPLASHFDRQRCHSSSTVPVIEGQARVLVLGLESVTSLSTDLFPLLPVIHETKVTAAHTSSPSWRYSIRPVLYIVSIHFLLGLRGPFETSHFYSPNASVLSVSRCSFRMHFDR